MANHNRNSEKDEKLVRETIESFRQGNFSALTDKKGELAELIKRANKKNNRSPKLKSPMKSSFAILFGLPFLIAGVAVLMFATSSWLKYFESENWLQVPCIINHVELKSHPGSDSTTYSVQAEYTYRYKNQAYIGNKVSLTSGSSSDYTYYRNIYDELERYRRSGEPFLGIINPKIPSESLLYRKMGLFGIILPIFGSVFALIGFFIIFLGLLSYWRKKRYFIGQKRLPREPWKWSHLWKNRTYKTRAGKKVLGLWMFSAFLSLFLSIFIIALLKTDSPAFAKIIVAVFVLIACGIIGFSIYKTLQFIKWGNSIFLFDRFPIAPGNNLKGRIRINKDIPVGEFTVYLICSEDKIVVTKSRSSRTSTVIRTDLYEQSYILSGYSDGSGNTVINIDLPVPDNKPATSESWHPQRKSVYWQLEISASTPGIDFKGIYELPVFDS